jgi:hypothetical protein
MKAHGLLITALLLTAMQAPVLTFAADSVMPQLAHPPLQSPIQRNMLSFSGATEWLNSSPLSTPDLRRRVVVVDFWTYSCINWRCSLPYVRTWAEK